MQGEKSDQLALGFGEFDVHRFVFQLDAQTVGRGAQRIPFGVRVLGGKEAFSLQGADGLVGQRKLFR